MVAFPKVLNDYTTVKPKIKILNLNFLHSQISYNYFYSCSANSLDIKKVKKKLKIDYKSAKIFKIKYDELIFENLIILHWWSIDSSTENLNTKLGYYETSDNVTRKFNEIIIGERLYKNSKNLKILNNEINYLKNYQKLNLFQNYKHMEKFL